MEYGKRLKQLREAKEFSIYRLSKDSDISQGHISDLENGKNQPTIETLKKLLTPMGITLSEFFNEDGEVSVLNDREKEIVTSFRTMNDENAALYLQLGKALSK
jgi:transcriptional regulator with XRE-family HTH domain